MKNNKRLQKSKNQIWLLLILIILVAFTGFLVWNYFIRPETRLDESSKPNDTGSKKDVGDNSTENTNPTEKDDNKTTAESDDKTPIQNEGDNPNTTTSLTGSVNNKSINSTTKQLVIRVTIDQFLQEAGACTLTLSNKTSAQVITKTAQTADNPSYSTCQGFDIPLSEINSGTWQLKLLVKTNSKSGEIDGGEIVIP